jgi:hypothetical protein
MILNADITDAYVDKLQDMGEFECITKQREKENENKNN